MTADMAHWPEEDARTYRAAGYWRGETYADHLTRLADEHGDRTAVVDERVRLSYLELDARAVRVAHGLTGLGIGAGDRVLVQLPNRAEFLVLWFALAKIGAVPVHTQPGHRHAELTHLARLSEASAYVIPDTHARFDHRDLAETVRGAAPSLRHVIVVGDPGDHGFTAYSDLEGARPAEPLPPHGARSGDMALLLLSGGTTGLPKLIPRTHDDYLYNARAAGEVCGLGPDTVYLAVLPVAFNYTMNCPGVLGALAVGGTVVMAPDPDPALCQSLVEAEGVTVTSINPQLAPLWLEEAAAGAADLSTLQILQVGSARLADDVAKRMVAELDCTVQQIFGMAEGLICLTRPTDPPEIVTTTQGRPISEADEVRVVDDDGTEVPEGEVGELLTRGPYTLRGYYRAAEHNARSFTADGFYRTGDRVRRVPTGHLIVAGRSKDQINRAGEKIAATEVEGHLAAHPTIRSAALVPAPDPVLGERSVAFVETTGQGTPTRRDLVGFLAERGLAAYKVPDEVRALDAMPLTPVGKADKKALAALLAETAEGAAR
ncbi:AMP-binding protein [Nocardiopsis exhalans]|uniref:AMP-binding protein n=1 Tax=Nocardiopsis exhalans TaxID=163604 RepID=A0ABY5DEF4_9ACTN|nr:AMP-binding protein [Nocardiopsis exhalans]USY22320.1 AMP-binding protein [Nocardiopsis exhalans]